MLCSQAKDQNACHLLFFDSRENSLRFRKSRVATTFSSAFMQEGDVTLQVRVQTSITVIESLANRKQANNLSVIQANRCYLG